MFAMFSKLNIAKAILWIFICSLLGTNLAITLITPKVEPYSQGAAIEFYQSKKNEKAVIEPLNFKSYAQLFYAERPSWLGGIKEDDVFTQKVPPGVNAYCVIKVQNAKKYEERYPQMVKLYEKNGFVFYQVRRN